MVPAGAATPYCAETAKLNATAANVSREAEISVNSAIGFVVDVRTPPRRPSHQLHVERNRLYNLNREPLHGPRAGTAWS